MSKQLARFEGTSRLEQVTAENYGLIMDFADSARIAFAPPGRPVSLEDEVFELWIPNGVHALALSRIRVEQKLLGN